MAKLKNRNVAPASGTTKIPPGLPDHLRTPVFEPDPWLDQNNRRFQALVSFRVYARDLEQWIRQNAPEYRPQSVQAALGTTLEGFLRVADDLPL